MSDYITTSNNFTQLCKYYTSQSQCSNCVMYNENICQTPRNRLMPQDYARAEKIINKWVDEHFTQKNKWTYIKDSLPKKNGRYLVINNNGFNIEIRSFALCLEDIDKFDFKNRKTSGWYNYDGENGSFYECKGIIYWMPLPELPSQRDKI